MNTKHTPGPWHTTGKRNGNGMFRVYADGNGQIGAAYTYAEGDAALIAAAPELLAVMADLLADLDAIGFERADDDVAGTECVDTVSQHIERLRAAIAKATGVTP